MLEGTLDSFSLPDIFQLLALTKKSGRLDLHSDRGQGKVWFRDGQVYYALASGGRLALGKRLAAAGRVTAEQVQQALEQQRELGGPRLGTILVEQRVIDDATLGTFVREQIQDAVFDLMRWSDGQFAFESALDLAEPIGLTVTVENLIMEGSRRLQEWDAVRKKIPGLEAVVAMAPAPDDAGVEVNLKPEEWRLLTMVDGRRTIGDLVELSGKGEFAVCKLLYGMVGAGVLEVRDVDVQGPSSVAAILDEVELIRQLEEGAAALEPAPQRRLASAPRAPDELSRPATPLRPAEASPRAAGTSPRPAGTFTPPAEAPPRAPGLPQRPTAVPSASESADVGGSTGPTSPKRFAAATERRITTDPDLDEETLDRLIAGVKAL